jgi:hypothetical protein
MHKNCLTALHGAGMLACAFALAGCALSPSKASASNVTTTRATGVGIGNTHIMAYSINSDGPELRSIVTGAIGDYGPAVTVDPDGRADSEHASELELKLTHGSFRLSVKSVEQAFAEAASKEPVYSGTCSDFISVEAAAPIVAGSGTGSYRGISGSFQLTITLNEVEASSCKPANPAAFRWQSIVLAGLGNISR